MENNPVNLPAIFKADIFKIIESNGNKIKAKCQLCLDAPGMISGCIKSTTNFLTHIRRKHPQHVDVLNNVIHRKRSSVSIVRNEDGQSPKKLKSMKCNSFTIASTNSGRKGISIEKGVRVSETTTTMCLQEPTHQTDTLSNTAQKKAIKLENSDDDNSNDDDHAVVKAMRELNESNDEFEIFGEYVASELKSLRFDHNRRKLKRIIQKAILDISEIDDGE